MRRFKGHPAPVLPSDTMNGDGNAKAPGHSSGQSPEHSSKHSNGRIAQANSTVDPWGIVSNLIAGIVIYGGLGYVIGRWAGHPSEGAAIGILAGLALSGYLINHKLRLGEDPTTTKGTPR